MDNIAVGYLRLIYFLPKLAGAILVAMVVSVLFDVTCRVAGIRLPAFSETFVEYGLVYATLISAPYLLREKVHVQVEAMMSLVPAGARLVVEKAMYLLAIVACLVVAVVSANLLLETIRSGRTDIRGISVPLWLLMAPFPPCFLLIAIEFGRYLFTSATYYSGLGKGENL